MYSSGASRDKKLLSKAEDMLKDAKTKIEIIRLQILRALPTEEGEKGEAVAETLYCASYYKTLRPSVRFPVEEHFQIENKFK